MVNTARRTPAESPEGVPVDVEILADAERLGVLLKDPRRTILAMAERPVSTVEMADRLGETRQRLGYHVRRLVEAGLLDEVEVVRQGAVVEKRYRASAACYGLAPELLGSLAARVGSADRESVVHLLGAVNEVQTDIARELAAPRSPEDRLPTLTLSTRIRFRDGAERGTFAEALTTALTDVVARYARSFEADDGSEVEGDPFRLTLTLNPTEP